MFYITPIVGPRPIDGVMSQNIYMGTTSWEHGEKVEGSNDQNSK